MGRIIPQLKVLPFDPGLGQAEKVVALRQEALEAMALKLPASNEAGLLDSGNSPAGVQ